MLPIVCLAHVHTRMALNGLCLLFKELVQLKEKSGGWEELEGRELEMGLSKTQYICMYTLSNNKKRSLVLGGCICIWVCAGQAFHSSAGKPTVPYAIEENPAPH